MRKSPVMYVSIKGLIAAVVLWALVPAENARAAESPAVSAEVARLQSDVARLERELAGQKQLILNMMAAEQQRYDVLLQLIRSTSGNHAELPPLPKPLAEAKAPAALDTKPVAAAAAQATTGKLQGQVTLPANAGQAYVYIEGLRGRIGTLRTVEIVQQNKQFAPRVVAVPVGTKLIFPNRDAIYHNVFSKSRGNSFDLGSLKGGETSSVVRLSRPGHIEIMCNMHSHMRSDVLVVPNGYYAEVNANGTFELDSVPTGTRKIVLWAPGIKPEMKVVEVAAGVTRVQISATAAPKRPHLNKFGQAYGSYDE